MEHIDRAATQRLHSRSVRPCEFCKERDPNFSSRMSLDQMVVLNRPYSASAHLSEEGYIRHRVLEVRQRLSRQPQTAA